MCRIHIFAWERRCLQRAEKYTRAAILRMLLTRRRTVRSDGLCRERNHGGRRRLPVSVRRVQAGHGGILQSEGISGGSGKHGERLSDRYTGRNPARGIYRGRSGKGTEKIEYDKIFTKF